jgi:hypothetical protein
MNRYRCETCIKKECWIHPIHEEEIMVKGNALVDPQEFCSIHKHTKQRGCTSHSDFKSGREEYVCTGESYDPEDNHCQQCFARQICPIENDEREKVLDELRTIREYDCIRFHQKHTLPKSWVEVKVRSVSKDGKRIGISGQMPGERCTTEMGIDLSDVRQVCRWIELRQQAGEP